MNKNEFIDRRTRIISKMLDNPNEYEIYPTTRAFAELDDLFDELKPGEGPSWAQIDSRCLSKKPKRGKR